MLCTATQPAIGQRENFSCGLTGIREIIPQELNLHERLRRVTVERIREKITDDDLAARLLGEPQVLCVVNTRRHARELFEKLRGASGESAQATAGDRTAYHLSAQMCPAHRSEILAEVRRRLAAGAPCKLVSTQLIEAGVPLPTINQALRTLRDKRWGGTVLQLTPAGLDALKALHGWTHDASADRKRKSEPPDPEQLRAIVRPMAGVRWP